MYQFGYIAMFGVTSPLIPIITAVFNMVDLRQRALTLLTKNKRPEPVRTCRIPHASLPSRMPAPGEKIGRGEPETSECQPPGKRELLSVPCLSR